LAARSHLPGDRRTRAGPRPAAAGRAHRAITDSWDTRCSRYGGVRERRVRPPGRAPARRARLV